MARNPNFDKPKSSKVSRTGFEKMQLSHARMRKEIQRIHAESAQRTATSKPRHAGSALRS